MKWQSMDTAPKDGAIVFVAARRVESDPLATMFAYWNQRLSWWYRFAASEPTRIYPTYWMPLPPCPDEAPMSVFDRYFDAMQAYTTETGHMPDHVHMSPATSARMQREASQLRIQDVPLLPPRGATPSGVVGWVAGCELHEDATMGDGFRFERTLTKAGA